jgi:hypothetical protein
LLEIVACRRSAGLDEEIDERQGDERRLLPRDRRHEVAATVVVRGERPQGFESREPVEKSVPVASATGPGFSRRSPKVAPSNRISS